jgi:hypothetical protein
MANPELIQYARFDTLFQLARILGQARRKGDLEEIRVAEAAHKEYESYCLQSNVTFVSWSMPKL